MATQILDGIDGGQTQIIAREEQDRAVPSGAMLQPGETVAGYTVKERLPASGGEAEVYVCAKDGKPYALKYYYTRKTETEVIDRIKQITHPGIVSVIDSGEYRGRFFTTLEYAAGGALDDKEPDGSFRYLPIGEDAAAGIVREIIEAFEACHTAGIIHRDIKPGNLLYKHAPDQDRAAGGILVGDFGIASVFEAEEGMSKHLTETGARTEGYAAPEVYSGVIGKELDYYALGVTLWVLLTGGEPFVDEEGRSFNINQIMLDTIQGRTADKLLARSPQISPNMKKLIRGLLVVRHDKRWGYDEVKRHLDGEDVEVFHEERTLPVVAIGGESCASYREIAEAILKHPEEGKKFVFQEKLSNYLIKIDQKRADQVDEAIDRFSAEKRENEGVVYVAYSLCPGLPFEVDHGRRISTFSDIPKILEDDPQALLPFLKDREKGFYAYLEVMNLAEEGKKVKEIVDSTSGGIRAAARIVAAFQGNVIAPFQDGVNDGRRLSSLDDLNALPDYLKKRTLIFVERNCGLLPAWIENMSGRNLDGWLSLLAEWREQVEEHGAWDYFNLFLQGQDIAVLVDYLVKNRDIAAIRKAVPWLREEKQYAAANKLVDRVWPEYYSERNWTTARELLACIDETYLEGLDRPLDFYLAHTGLCLYREDQIDTALEYLNRALSLNRAGFDRDDIPYVYALGCSFMRKGDMSRAAAAFDDTISLKPDLPQALLRKAACFLSLRNYNGAAACCSRLLEGGFSGPAFERTAQSRAYKIRSLSYSEMEDMQDRASDDLAKANTRMKGAVDIFDDYLSGIDGVIDAFEAYLNVRIEEQKHREAEKNAVQARQAAKRAASAARKKVVFALVFWGIFVVLACRILYATAPDGFRMGELSESYGVISTIRTVCGVIGALLGGCIGLFGGVIGAAIGGVLGFFLFRFLLGGVFGALFTTGIGHILIAFMAIVPFWFFYKWRMEKWRASTAALAWPPVLTAVAIFLVMFSGTDVLFRAGLLQRLGLFRRGAVAEESVGEEPPVVTATVTSAAANIRSAPDSSKNNVIIQMKAGDTLIVTGPVANGWLPVEANGQAGYVSADLVAITP
jgi:serine/threonine protein kinase